MFKKLVLLLKWSRKKSLKNQMHDFLFATGRKNWRQDLSDHSTIILIKHCLPFPRLFIMLSRRKKQRCLIIFFLVVFPTK